MNLISDIKRKVLQGEELYSIPGKVTAIDETTRTATIEPVEGPELQEVRLQATSGSDKGIYIKPALDSFVLVSWITKEEAFVSLFTEIDEIQVIGDQDIQVKSDSGSIKIESNKDLEISSSSGKVGIENSSGSVKELLEEIIDLLNGTYILTTPAGPSTGPDPSTITQLNLIKSKIGQVLK